MTRDVGLEALVAADLAALTGLEQKKMFGGICWMWRGNLLCGADHSGILLRLGKGRDDWALDEGVAEPMVMGGRRMEGWVRLPASHAQKAPLRHRLLAAAQDFAATLPAK